MERVRIRYRCENEGWWAESEDLPGWTAVGPTFTAVREQARTGVAEFAGPDKVIEEEGVPLSGEQTSVWEIVTKHPIYSNLQSGASMKVYVNIVPSAAPARPGGIGAAKADLDDTLSALAPALNNAR